MRDSPTAMTVALIVAAGSGERLGAGRPKALVELGGRPLLDWSIEALRRAPGGRADRRRAAGRRRSAPGGRRVGVDGRRASRSDSVRARARGRRRRATRCSSTTPPGRCSRRELAEAVLAALATTPTPTRRSRPRRSPTRSSAPDDGAAPCARRSTAASCGRCRRRRSSAAPRSSARSTSPAEDARRGDRRRLAGRARGRAGDRRAGRAPRTSRSRPPLDLRVAELLLAERAPSAADPA